MQRWFSGTRLFKFLFGATQPARDAAPVRRSAADALEAHEKKAVLHHLLSRLNAEERAALVLFEIEGYSGEEIARIQEVPVTQVWSRIYRARTKLRTWLTSAEKQLRQSA